MKLHQPILTAPGDHRNGDWTQTYMGVQFWPLDPRPHEILLEDIAHSLAKICRYNGHSIDHYSVAEHSVLVSQHVRPEHRLQALMHDAPEAYLGDVIRPVKKYLKDFGEHENRLLFLMGPKFWFNAKLHENVHHVDDSILADEKGVLFRHDLPWFLPQPPLGIADDIKCLTAKQAKRLFLKTYYELTGKKE